MYEFPRYLNESWDVFCKEETVGELTDLPLIEFLVESERLRGHFTISLQGLFPLSQHQGLQQRKQDVTYLIVKIDT